MALDLKLIPVMHHEDPRVADFVRIQERDLVLNRGIFLVEGPETLRTMVECSSYRLRALFVSRPRLPSIADVLARLDVDLPVYVAEQALMDEIVGHPIHRGVLASGTIDQIASSKAVLERIRSMNTVIVLENVGNHDNLGGIFRVARAFGVDAVLLDDQTAHPLYRKAIRVSIGAALVVPFARLGPLPAGLDLLEEAGFEICAFTPRKEAEDLLQMVRTRSSDMLRSRVALVLGAEGPGLTEATLARAHRKLAIPMKGGTDSINIACACAIGLFARDCLDKTPPVPSVSVGR